LINYSVYGDYAEALPERILMVTKKYEKVTTARRIKMFQKFTAFVEDRYGVLTEGNHSAVFRDFRSHVYHNRNGNSVVTADSDYRAWNSLVRTLIKLKYLPGITTPDGIHSSNPNLKSSRHMSCLGSMNPKLWNESYKSKDMVTLQSSPSEEYLENFIEHQRNCRSIIVSKARDYIIEAESRFKKGRLYISNTSPSDFTSPKLLHATAHGNGSGQHYSLFSDKLPKEEGIQNLVGYLHHIRKGLLTRDFPGGNNHLYSYGGRVELQEHFGLSTMLATACAIVIISETGINSTSLYRLTYDPNSNIISQNDIDGVYTFEYNKPRAGGLTKRTIAKSAHLINAEYCINLILEQTEDYRNKVPIEVAKKLFITDSVAKEGELQAMSDLGFKGCFRKLTEMTADIDFIDSLPNLSKLRVTGGIIAWHESGGDPRAAARYLGNSTSVAIKNYIPKELQEFFYRKQIRQFQNLLIAVATDGQEYQAAAINITNEQELHEYLQNHVLDSGLYKRAYDTETLTTSKVTFILSESNISFLSAAQSNYKIQLNSKKLTTGNKLSNNINSEVKKWHDIATIIFSYIRSQGTRRQQHIMSDGIQAYNDNPLNFDMEVS
jgi:hypothetical protein